MYTAAVELRLLKWQDIKKHFDKECPDKKDVAYNILRHTEHSSYIIVTSHTSYT